MISSWLIQSPPSTPRNYPPALYYAVRQRIRLLDLYFLDGSDLDWYLRIAKDNPKVKFTEFLKSLGEILLSQVPELKINTVFSTVFNGSNPKKIEDAFYKNPVFFAASLTPVHVDRIGKELVAGLAKHYEGELFGLRPRFGALATFWPMISLTEDEDKKELAGCRKAAVKALQNCLYLAKRIGCNHVEAVGGSAVPEQTDAQETERNVVAYREKRKEAIIKSIEEIYNVDDLANIFNRKKEDIESSLPFMCLEAEPGAGYLFKDAESIIEVINRLGSDTLAKKKTLMNVDVAHFFLIDQYNEIKRKKGSKVAKKQIDVIKRRKKLVGHMHLSDHTRAHASDLTPGTYHFFNNYKPWLDLATELCNRRDVNFSNIIAVELEAVNDVFEATRAVAKIRGWLENLRLKNQEKAQNSRKQRNSFQFPLSEGALLAVDIGKSTEAIITRFKGVENISGAITALCDVIYDNNGSVLSFTGDGVIAFFDKNHFLDVQDAIKFAGNAARSLGCEVIRRIAPIGDNEITLRVALHYGKICVPTTGELRHQAIGPEVVRVTRVLDWITKQIEPAIPPSNRNSVIATTAEFWNRIQDINQGIVRRGGFRKRDFKKWGEHHLKGLPKKSVLYLEKRFIPR